MKILPQLDKLSNLRRLLIWYHKEIIGDTSFYKMEAVIIYIKFLWIFNISKFKRVAFKFNVCHNFSISLKYLFRLLYSLTLKIMIFSKIFFSREEQSRISELLLQWCLGKIVTLALLQALQLVASLMLKEIREPLLLEVDKISNFRNSSNKIQVEIR